MKSPESLLGFKVRMPPKNLPPWPLERRKTYLLRADVNRPLSVDPRIWPDLEYADLAPTDPQYADLVAEVFDDYYRDSVSNGLNIYTKSSADRLRRLRQGLIVAFTANSKDAVMLRRLHKIDESQLSPSELRSSGFRRLGYDVADQWLYSGLMNCALNASERKLLSPKFQAALNDAGLFTSAQLAEKFRLQCNRLIPEHAPFLVYGIWLKSLREKRKND